MVELRIGNMNIFEINIRQKKNHTGTLKCTNWSITFQ